MVPFTLLWRNMASAGVLCTQRRESEGGFCGSLFLTPGIRAFLSRRVSSTLFECGKLDCTGCLRAAHPHIHTTLQPCTCSSTCSYTGSCLPRVVLHRFFVGSAGGWSRMEAGIESYSSWCSSRSAVQQYRGVCTAALGKHCVHCVSCT